MSLLSSTFHMGMEKGEEKGDQELPAGRTLAVQKLRKNSGYKSLVRNMEQ